MEAGPKGFRVSAKTAPLIVDALGFYAREGVSESGLTYRVDLWTPDGISMLEAIARAGNLNVARVAYQAAVETWPGQALTLRKATLTLERTRPRTSISAPSE